MEYTVTDGYMSGTDTSYSILIEKIYRHYSENGLAGLIGEFRPFIMSMLIDSRRTTAAEIYNESETHKVWKSENEAEIEIPEPSQHRLRQEFESYPKRFHPEPSAVYELQDCHLVGPYGTGLYKGRRLLSETAGCRVEERFVGSGLKLVEHSIKSRLGRKPDSSKQSVFPLISPDPSYYHWMMEYLPKLRLLELYRDRTGRDPTVLIEPNPRSFVLDTLECAGYGPTRYEEWQQQDMAVEDLIVCTHRAHEFDYKNPELSNYNPSVTDFQWLRDRLTSNGLRTEHESSFADRIYISRQKADRGRKVVNYEQFSDVLAKHGFESYTVEDYPFHEQLALFHGADVIMGPHGAGLVNMLFSEDPTVIELFPDSVVKPHFHFLAKILDFDYHSVITESENNDLVVDPAAVEELLSTALDSSRAA